MKDKQLPPFEFSRPLIVDRVKRKGSHEFVEADEKERLALAKRFSIPQIHALSGRLVVAPWRGGGVKISGTVDADITQVSIVSLEDFRKHESFAVQRYFLPAKEVDETVEDDADPIMNGEVDLGEIVAEALGLELDPYPRKEGEVFGTTPEKPGKN